MGNFVSFPAEIMRTSANIIKRAVDDIKFVDEATGTAPLRAIGYQRLFGFGATAVAIPYGTVEAAKALYNVSGDPCMTVSIAFWLYTNKGPLSCAMCR